MEAYQQIKENTVVGFQDLGSYTKDYINTADEGSLRGTIYSHDGSHTLKELPGLKEADEVTINIGRKLNNLEPSEYKRINKRLESGKKPLNPYYREFREQIKFGKNLESQGVDVNYYGQPFGRKQLHSKLFISEQEGKESLFISTGNLHPSGLSPLGEEQTKNNIPFFGRQQYGTSKNRKYEQINIGVEYRDPQKIKEAKQFLTEVKNDKIPTSKEHLKTGQKATNEVLRILEKAKEGSKVNVTSPYIDDERVASALVEAKKRGAEVELITHGGEGGSQVKQRVVRRLESSGVRVLTDGGEGLIHTKAVSVKTKNDKYYSAFGSHNLTNAANKVSGQTIDVLMFDQGRVSKKIFEQTYSKNLGKEISLYYANRDSAPKYNEIESRMLKRGFTHYRMGAYSGSKTPNLPYHPTSLPAKFFANYRNREIPDLTPYSDLYRARTGREPPESVKKFDEALMSPGLGGKLNQLTGKELYREDKGVIGSSFYSTGRFIDWAFGHDYTRERERKAAGEHSGTVRGFFKYLDKDHSEETGLAEWFLGTTSDIVRNTAQAVGFYALVNLPLQHLRAQLAAEPIKGLLKADPNRADNSFTSNIKRRAGRFARNFVFGPEYGNILTEAIEEYEIEELDRINRGGHISEKPYSVPEKFSQKLTERQRVTSNDPESILGRAFDENGNPRGFISWEKSSGLTSLITSFRKFEKARFQDVLRPVLEAVNPYSYGNENRKYFIESLDQIERALERGPTVHYKNRGSNTSELELKGMGSKRISHIFKQFDKLGHLLPLNPAYWVPSIREGLGLPEFDPSKQMTWSRVWPMEETSKAVEGLWKFVGNTLKRPGQIIREAKSLWEYNRKSNQIFDKRQSTSTRNLDIGTIDSYNSRAEYLDELYQAGTQSYTSATQEIQDIQNERQFREYIESQKGLDDTYRKIKSRFPLSPIGEEFYAEQSSTGSSITNNRETFIKGRNARRFLLATGALMFSDVLVDKLFMGGGPSILRQLSTAMDLKTEEGEVARFSFEGNVPNSLGLLAMAGGYAAGGYLFPDFVDTGKKQINIVKGESISNQFKQQYAVNLGDSPVQASKNKRTYKQAQQEYQEKLKTIGTHKKLKFSHPRAIGASLLAGLTTKVASSAIAAGANLLFNTGGPLESIGRGMGSLIGIDNKETGLNLDEKDALLAMSLEDDLVSLINRADSREEKARSVIGKYILESSLGESKPTGDVFSIARQLPIPFFQLTGVARTQGTDDRIEFGFGPQLMPSSGLGITSLLPFSLRTKARQPTKEEDLANLNFSIGKMSLIEKFQYLGAKGLDKVTLSGSEAGNIVGERDNGFLNAVDFLGAVTFGTLTANNIMNRYGQRIRDRVNASNELTYIKNRMKPLAKGVTKGYSFLANGVVANILGLPIRMGKGLPRATSEFIRNVSQVPDQTNTPPKGSTLGEKTGRLIGSKGFRRAALVYGVATLTSALAEPDAGSEGFRDPIERFQAVVGTTALMSTAILKSGALESQEEIASRIHQNLSTSQKEELLKRVFPNLSNKASVSRQSYERAIREGARITSNQVAEGKLGLNPRQMMADLASDELIKQAWEAAGNDLKDLPDYGKGNRSIRGRIALGAGAVFASKFFAHRAISFLPKETAQNLTNTPIIGPTISLLTGYDEEYQAFDEYERERAHPMANQIGWLSRTLTANMFDFSETFGLYTDKPDPYIGLVGPFGVSFKDEDVKFYSQYQGNVTDFSMASHSMLKYGFRKYKRLGEVLGQVGKTSGMEAAFDKLLAYQYRNSPAQASEMRPSEREAAGTLTGRLLAIRQMKLQNVLYKTPMEQFLNYSFNQIRSGRISDPTIPEGKLSKIWSPYNSFSSIRGGMVKREVPSEINQYSVKQLFMGTISQSQVVDRSSKGIMNLFKKGIIDSEESDLPSGLRDLLSLGTYVMGGALGIASLASFAYTGYTITNYLGQRKQKQTIFDLVKESTILSKKGVVQPKKYQYIDTETPDGKQILQVDSKTRNVKGTLYNYSSDELGFASELTRNSISGAEVIEQKYQNWAYSVNNYFSGTFNDKIWEAVKSMAEADSRSSVWESLKQELYNSSSNLKENLDTKIVEGSRISTFDLLFQQGKGSNFTSSDFLDEAFGHKFLDPVLQEAERIWYEQDLGRLDRTEAHTRLISSLEETTAFQAMTSKLTEPTTAQYEYNLGEKEKDRLSRKAKTERQSGTATTAQSQGWASYNMKLRSQSIFEDTLRGTHGLAEGAGWWLNSGRNIYTITESLSVALNEDKDTTFRKHAGRLAAEESTYFGISFGISKAVGSILARLAAGGPVGALVTTGVGIAAEFATHHLLTKVDTLSKMADELYKGTADWLVNTKDKFQDYISWTGDTVSKGITEGLSTILSPVSSLIGGVASVANSFFERTTVPFLKEQWSNMSTDGSAMRIFKSLFLPRTAYHNLESDKFRRRAMRRFDRALEPNRSVSTDTLHPNLLGFPQDYRERETYQMYFKGYSGQRLLQEEFGLHNYGMSNIMRLYLERQQGLYDQRVIGSQAKRLGSKEEPFGIGLFSTGLIAGIASVAFNQREGIRHFLTKKSSKKIVDSADKELDILRRKVGVDRDQFELEFENRRRGHEGRYQFRRNQAGKIYLSSPVENVLGRSYLGGAGSPSRGQQLKARFTALHEMAHVKQFELQEIHSRRIPNQPDAPQLLDETRFRQVFDDDVLGLDQKQNIIDTAKKLAYESATKTTREMRAKGQNVSKAQLYDIYQKEVQANLTAIRFASNKSTRKAQARDAITLERKLRNTTQVTPQQINSIEQTQGQAFSSTSAEIDFYSRTSNLYSTSGGVKPYILHGINSVREFIGGIKQNLNTFFGELEEQEKRNIQNWVDSIFSSETDKSIQDLISQRFGKDSSASRVFNLLSASNNLIWAEVRSARINADKPFPFTMAVMKGNRLNKSFYSSNGNYINMPSGALKQAESSLESEAGLTEEVIKKIGSKANIIAKNTFNYLSRGFGVDAIKAFSKIRDNNLRTKVLADFSTSVRDLNYELNIKAQEIQKNITESSSKDDIKDLKNNYYTKLNELKELTDNYQEYLVKEFEKIDEVKGTNVAKKLSDFIELQNNYIANNRNHRTYEGRVADANNEILKKARGLAISQDYRDISNLAIEEFFGNLGRNIKQGVQLIGDIVGEYGKRAVKTVSKPFEPILRPIYGGIANVGTRLRKAGVGEFFGEVLGRGFTVGDTWLGFSVKHSTTDLNNENTDYEDIKRRAKERLGAYTSTFFGNAVEFITASMKYQVLAGGLSLWSSMGTQNLKYVNPEADRESLQNDPLALFLYNSTDLGSKFIQSAMKTLFNKEVSSAALHKALLTGDWTGFAKSMAEKDKEKLEEGEAVYSELQSVGFYTRMHKSMEVEKATSRQLIQDTVGSTIRGVSKGAEKALDQFGKKIVEPVVKGINRVITETIKWTAPVVTGAYEVFVKPVLELGKFIYNNAINPIVREGQKRISQLSNSVITKLSKFAEPRMFGSLSGLGGAIYLFSHTPNEMKKVSEDEMERYRRLKKKDNLTESQKEFIEDIEERLEIPAWQRTTQRVLKTAAGSFVSYTSVSGFNQLLRDKTNLKNKKFIGSVSNLLDKADREIDELVIHPKKTLKRWSSHLPGLLTKEFRGPSDWLEKHLKRGGKAIKNSFLRWTNRKKGQVNLLARQTGRWVRSSANTIRNIPSDLINIIHNELQGKQVGLKTRNLIQRIKNDPKAFIKGVGKVINKGFKTGGVLGAVALPFADQFMEDREFSATQRTGISVASLLGTQYAPKLVKGTPKALKTISDFSKNEVIPQIKHIVQNPRVFFNQMRKRMSGTGNFLKRSLRGGGILAAAILPGMDRIIGDEEEFSPMQRSLIAMGSLGVSFSPEISKGLWEVTKKITPSKDTTVNGLKQFGHSAKEGIKENLGKAFSYAKRPKKSFRKFLRFVKKNRFKTLGAQIVGGLFVADQTVVRDKELSDLEEGVLTAGAITSTALQGVDLTHSKEVRNKTGRKLKQIGSAIDNGLYKAEQGINYVLNNPSKVLSDVGNKALKALNTVGNFANKSIKVAGKGAGLYFSMRTLFTKEDDEVTSSERASLAIASFGFSKSPEAARELWKFSKYAWQNKKNIYRNLRDEKIPSLVEGIKNTYSKTEYAVNKAKYTARWSKVMGKRKFSKISRIGKRIGKDLNDYKGNIRRSIVWQGGFVLPVVADMMTEEDLTDTEFATLGVGATALGYTPEIAKAAKWGKSKLRQSPKWAKHIGRYGIGGALQATIWGHDAHKDEDEKMGILTRTALSGVSGVATHSLEAAQLGRGLKGLWNQTGKRLGNWARNKLIKPSVNWLMTTGKNRAIENSKKPFRKLASNYISRGFWDSGLNVLSSVFDISGMAMGTEKLLSLDENSSAADYQLAAAQLRKARRALVGSIIGQTLGGDFLDGVLATTFDFNSDVKHEQAELWAESNTHGGTILARELRRTPQEVTAGIGIGRKLQKLTTKQFGKYASRVGAERAAQVVKQYGKNVLPEEEVSDFIEYISRQTGEDVDSLTRVQGKLARATGKSTKPYNYIDSAIKRKFGKVSSNFLARAGRHIVGRAHLAHYMAKKAVREGIVRRYQNIFGKNLDGTKVKDPSVIGHSTSRVLRYGDISARQGKGFLRNILDFGRAAKNSKVGMVGGSAIRHSLPVVGQAIDAYMIGSGLHKTITADSKADKIVGFSRATGGAFSLAGDLIGGAIGGPIGSAVLSLAGDQLGRRYGKNVAKRAIGTDTKMKDVAKAGSMGGAVGAITGLAAGIAIGALGIGTGGLGLLALGAIGAGTGAIGGWTGGTEAALYHGMGHKQYMKKTLPDRDGLSPSELKQYSKYQVRGSLSDSKKEDEAEKEDKETRLSSRSIKEDKEEAKNKNLFQRAMQTVKSYLFGSTEYEKVRRRGKDDEQVKVKREKKGLLQRLNEGWKQLTDKVGDAFNAVGEGFNNLMGNLFGSSTSKKEAGNRLSSSRLQSWQNPHVKRAKTRDRVSQKELVKHVGLPLKKGNNGGAYDVSPEFRAKTERIANDLDMNPNHLMAIMSFETGRTFSPSVKNKAGSGATGLIQFMPDTARGLGTSTSELAKMSRLKQLDYVEKHLKSHKGEMDSIEDAYMAVLYPEAVGKSLDYGLFKKGTEAYSKNASLDINNDGVITKREASSHVKDHYKEGIKVDKNANIKSGQFSMEGVWEVIKKDTKEYKNIHDALGNDKRVERYDKAIKHMGKGEYFTEAMTKRLVNQLKESGATEEQIKQVRREVNKYNSSLSKEKKEKAKKRGRLLPKNPFSIEKIKESTYDVRGYTKNKVPESKEPKRNFTRRSEAQQFFTIMDSDDYEGKHKIRNFNDKGLFISSGFGYRNIPVGTSNHYGVDVVRHGNKKVKQTNPFQKARVVETMPSVGKIKLAELNKDGQPTGRHVIFYHTSNIRVKSGQVIPFGTQVGAEGNKGKSTGSHSDARFFVEGQEGVTVQGQSTINSRGRHFYAPTVEEVLAAHGATKNPVIPFEKQGDNYKVTGFSIRQEKKEKEEQAKKEKKKQEKQALTNDNNKIAKGLDFMISEGESSEETENLINFLEENITAANEKVEEAQQLAKGKKMFIDKEQKKDVELSFAENALTPKPNKSKTANVRKESEVDGSTKKVVEVENNGQEFIDSFADLNNFEVADEEDFALDNSLSEEMLV